MPIVPSGARSTVSCGECGATEKSPLVQRASAPAWHGAEQVDECPQLAKSRKTRTRMPGQTDVRWTSSTRQPASDPRSQTAEPQNNRCDVAASCPHSISAKRLECCTDRLSPPPKR